MEELVLQRHLIWKLLLSWDLKHFLCFIQNFFRVYSVNLLLKISEMWIWRLIKQRFDILFSKSSSILYLELKTDSIVALLWYSINIMFNFCIVASTRTTSFFYFWKSNFFFSVNTAEFPFQSLEKKSRPLLPDPYHYPLRIDIQIIHHPTQVFRYQKLPGSRKTNSLQNAKITRNTEAIRSTQSTNGLKFEVTVKLIEMYPHPLQNQHSLNTELFRVFL